MRRTRRRVGAGAGLLAAASIAWLAQGAPAPGDEPSAADEPREPFTSPLTDDEARWLIDESEGRRFRDPADGQMQRLLPRDVEAVRESLGGSVIRDFPSLGGEGPERTPWWQQFRGSLEPPAAAEPPLDDPRAGTPEAALRRGWGITLAPAEVVPAAAMEAPPASEIPVATLRSAAEGLDHSANRLEELQLYEQADDMRELAQKLRVDARRLAAGGEPIPHADSQDPDDSSENAGE
jgi:hypothetical protein